MIRFLCSVCQNDLQAFDELAGDSVACPKCNLSVQVPEKAQGLRPETGTKSMLVMGQWLQDLEKKVAEIDVPGANLAQELRFAHLYIKQDPGSSLTKSRLILEKMLLKIYQTEMGKDPKKPMLGDILLDNQFTRKLARRIVSRMNSIRDMANFGPHGEYVEPADAARVLEDLGMVIDWYQKKYPEKKPPAEAKAAPLTAAFTIPEAGVEPVPGYCLVERLGRGGYGEVWRSYAPGGFQVALKFVPLKDACGAVELRALDVIRDIRHPNLLVTFASWQVNDWLIIAMELADKTLMDRFREAKDQGLPGIPRDELLDYFQEAARGIDFLNEPRQIAGGAQRFAVQHRDIKPQNILLVGNGVKVADFGLARLMSQAQTGHSGGMTPAYAAPEFFKGQTSSSSDQYCFAVTYCKMRGGCLPFDGALPEVMAGHLSVAPELHMLPNAERGVVARALSKEPKDRWPSCRAFVDALLACDNVPQGKDVESSSTITYSGVPLTQSRPPAAGIPAAPTPAPKMPAATLVPPSEPVDPAGAAAEPSLAPRMTFQPPGANDKPQGRSWVIGRDAACHVVVNQNAVSGQHCRLTETAKGYVLEDLDSSNGTYVNGHKITGAAHVVASDEITLGQSIPMPWPSVAKAPADAQVIHIGRDPDNDIVLDYTTVSSRHARILIRSGQAHIEDLGSTNGIAIGQPNAKVSQAVLHPDDVVYFGSLPVPAARLLQGAAKQTGVPRAIIFRGQPIVLGRNAGCDQILDFPMISGRHARLWPEGGRIMIEDLGSTNGTFVNGERVPLSAEVKARDVIGMGSLLLELQVSS